MTLRLGAQAPDFRARSTHGPISFHEWIGDDWCVLFSHPKDFTPVCTTELGAMARMMKEFARRGVKVVGLGTDRVEDHLEWSSDIEETQGAMPEYPIIADTDLKVSKLYGMLPDDFADDAGGLTAQDLFTVRSTFLISPDKRIQMMLVYPMTAGRNMEELLRVIDSIQLSAAHKVGTPAGWNPGGDVLILPSVADAEARERFPGGWRAPKPYLRFVPQPA